MAGQTADLIPESILLFAAEAYGNYFGISLSGSDAGTVYFVDHETLPATADFLIPVAKSFTEFLQRCSCDFVDAPAATTVVEAIESGDCEALARCSLPVQTPVAPSTALLATAICESSKSSFGTAVIPTSAERSAEPKRRSSWRLARVVLIWRAHSCVTEPIRTFVAAPMEPRSRWRNHGPK
jgi:hypothetical protein